MHVPGMSLSFIHPTHSPFPIPSIHSLINHHARDELSRLIIILHQSRSRWVTLLNQMMMTLLSQNTRWNGLAVLLPRHVVAVATA